MKGFPERPDGPVGPWLRRVNDAVALVSEGMSREAVVELLGVPDDIQVGGNDPSAPIQEAMEQLAGGPTLIQYGSTQKVEAVLSYNDPYRPRRRYRVVIRGGVVSSVQQHTLALSAVPTREGP
jgi:hypothetical protein